MRNPLFCFVTGGSACQPEVKLSRNRSVFVPVETEAERPSSCRCLGYLGLQTGSDFCILKSQMTLRSVWGAPTLKVRVVWFMLLVYRPASWVPLCPSLSLPSVLVWNRLPAAKTPPAGFWFRVWSKSVSVFVGMLVVNVTWRNKTYVGTLLDCTRHDWAPPRYVREMLWFCKLDCH